MEKGLKKWKDLTDEDKEKGGYIIDRYELDAPII
jgi:hypothetical protein